MGTIMLHSIRLYRDKIRDEMTNVFSHWLSYRLSFFFFVYLVFLQLPPAGHLNGQWGGWGGGQFWTNSEPHLTEKDTSLSACFRPCLRDNLMCWSDIWSLNSVAALLIKCRVLVFIFYFNVVTIQRFNFMQNTWFGCSFSCQYES